MASEVTYVGYTCAFCGNRVVVLRSSEPPKQYEKEIIVECACGLVRRIALGEIQELDVWKERSS